MSVRTLLATGAAATLLVAAGPALPAGASAAAGPHGVWPIPVRCLTSHTAPLMLKHAPTLLGCPQPAVAG